jgi:PAS domain S-box-containing protein
VTPAQGLFLLPYIACSAVCLAIAGYVHKYRLVEASRFFSYKALTEALIVAAFVLETASLSLPEKVIWDDVQFVLDLALPAVQYFFVLAVARRAPRFSPSHLLLAAPPVAYLAVAATDPLIMRDWVYLRPAALFPELLYGFSTVQLAFALYVLLFMLFNASILVRAAIRARGVFRSQLVVVAAATLVPLAAGCLTIAGVRLGPYRDMSPFALTIANLLVLPALARFELFVLVPVARDLALEHMDVAFCVEDAAARIVDMNAKACQLLDTTLAEVIGKSTGEVFTAYSDVEAATRDQDNVVLEVAGRRARTLGRTYEVHVTTVRAAGGRRLGRLMLIQDITAHKALAAELAGTRDQLAERLAQLQAAQGELLRSERLAVLGRTVATVSHEIRNPLGTIRNALFSLREAVEQGDASRATRSIELAERNVRRCDAIIEELLDYTRRQPPALQETDVDAWLGEVLDEMALPGETAVTRELRCGARIPLDRERMRRAVLNVCLNAAQAMAEPGAAGRTLTVRSSDTEASVELAFTDQGTGMPPDVLARAGEPLYSTKAYGVGLGLSIVKAILAEHDGRLVVESTPGAGTAVVFRLRKEGPA